MTRLNHVLLFIATVLITPYLLVSWPGVIVFFLLAATIYYKSPEYKNKFSERRKKVHLPDRKKVISSLNRK